MWWRERSGSAATDKQAMSAIVTSTPLQAAGHRQAVDMPLAAVRRGLAHVGHADRVAVDPGRIAIPVAVHAGRARLLHGDERLGQRHWTVCDARRLSRDGRIVDLSDMSQGLRPPGPVA